MVDKYIQVTLCKKDDLMGTSKAPPMYTHAAFSASFHWGRGKEGEQIMKCLTKI